MIGPPAHTQVWLVAGHTDMRKGFDGLAASRSPGRERTLASFAAASRMMVKTNRVISPHQAEHAFSLTVP